MARRKVQTPKARTYQPRDLETRKAWVREQAAGFVRMQSDAVGFQPEQRRDVAYRAVDMACHIWDQVEGRFAGDGKDGE